MEGLLEINGSLSGSLTPMRSLVSGTLTIPQGIDIQTYDGSYEITPLSNTEQLLETSGKYMQDDVTILAIPYYETTNESGGYTVIIG